MPKIKRFFVISVLMFFACASIVFSPSDQKEKAVVQEKPKTVESGLTVNKTQPGAIKESIAVYSFVASSESDKYHEPSCRWVKNILEKNLIFFDTEIEAKSHGYDPCKTCNP